MSETPRQQRNRSGERAEPTRPTIARRKPGAPFQAAHDPTKKPNPQQPAKAPERRGGTLRDDEDTMEIISDEEE